MRRQLPLPHLRYKLLERGSLTPERLLLLGVPVVVVKRIALLSVVIGVVFRTGRL